MLAEKEKKSVRSFRDLEVWQAAMDLADFIYDATRDFPKEETYGLSSQLRRAAVSVASNIAEGSARNNTKELMQFIYISRGSLAELETQCELARRRKFMTDEIYNQITKQSQRIGQMTARLIQSLQR